VVGILSVVVQCFWDGLNALEFGLEGIALSGYLNE